MCGEGFIASHAVRRDASCARVGGRLAVAMASGSVDVERCWRSDTGRRGASGSVGPSNLRRKGEVLRDEQRYWYHG